MMPGSAEMVADKKTRISDAERIRLLRSRHKALVKQKAPWLDRFQEVVDYVSPHRENFKNDGQEAMKRATKVYDGTAIGAAVLATDGIHGYHVSPAFSWFRYIMSRTDLMNDKDINEWLQDGVNHGMYSALNRSNFYEEEWTRIYDGLTIGTSSMYIEENLNDRTITFDACHPGECFVAENQYGVVDVMHRTRKLPARVIIQRFGREKVPPRIREAYERDPYQEFEVIHCVEPREDYNPTSILAKDKKYASIWYVEEGEGHILRESGYDYFPFPTWRYLRTGRTAYGLSPAILAMCDIQGVNLMNKTLQGYAQVALNPPLNVPAELRGQVEFRPMGRNYYKDHNRIVTPVNIGGNFPIGIDREQAKQAAIRERFHVDTFLMLANLEGRGQRTAYEVSEMMGEKAAVLGAELGPLNRTLGDELDIVFEIETRAGRIPPPPDALLEQMQEDDRLTPEYLGPLAQAQRAKFGGMGIAQGLNAATPILQMFPAAADNIDEDRTLLEALDTAGFPAKCLRSEKDREARRMARQKQMEAEQKRAAMVEGAKGLKDMAAADQDMGGPLSKLLNSNTGALGEQVPAATEP